MVPYNTFYYVLIKKYLLTMIIIDYLEGLDPLLIGILIIGLLSIKGIIPFLPFPKELLQIYAGARFGIFIGSIISFLGLFLGGTLGYHLAKTGRYNFDNRSQRFVRYQGKLDKIGWKALIPLRFSPITAQDVTSFASGFAKINKKHYYPITILAFILYGTLFAYFGHYSISKWTP
ncbi:MAG: VTT domain-containing protein [Candidatus Kariarchaeaceae archaeon]